MTRITALFAIVLAFVVAGCGQPADPKPTGEGEKAPAMTSPGAPGGATSPGAAGATTGQ